MKLVNSTPVDPAFLHEVIRFALPPGIYLKEIREVKFDNTRLGFHGRAWSYERRVTIGVPPRTRYKRPHKRGGFRGYLPQTYYSWEEELVGLVAHELRHLWQYKHGRKLPRVTRKIRRNHMGTSAKLIEVDATRYEIQVSRRWRREISGKTASPRADRPE